MIPFKMSVIKMINFIIEDLSLKEIIDKIMMNYNYRYNIKEYPIETNTTNSIYLINYNPNEILSLSKIRHIRYDLKDWSSIIILFTKNKKIKNDLYDKKYLILDIINSNIELNLKEDINLILNNIFSSNKYLNYSYKNIYYNIPLQDIYYIENDSANKRCLIKTFEDTFYIPESISKILNQLDKNFIKCSRSYIINLKKVRYFSIKNNIIYFNKEIKVYEVSRNKKKELINFLRNID